MSRHFFAFFALLDGERVKWKGEGRGKELFVLRLRVFVTRRRLAVSIGSVVCSKKTQGESLGLRLSLAVAGCRSGSTRSRHNYLL